MSGDMDAQASRKTVMAHGDCQVTVTCVPMGAGYRADWRIEPNEARALQARQPFPKTRSGSRFVDSDAAHQFLLADLRLLLDSVCGPSCDERLEEALGADYQFTN